MGTPLNTQVLSACEFTFTKAGNLRWEESRFKGYWAPWASSGHLLEDSNWAGLGTAWD